MFAYPRGYFDSVIGVSPPMAFVRDVECGVSLDSFIASDLRPQASSFKRHVKRCNVLSRRCNTPFPFLVFHGLAKAAHIAMDAVGLNRWICGCREVDMQCRYLMDVLSAVCTRFPFRSRQRARVDNIHQPSLIFATFKQDLSRRMQLGFSRPHRSSPALPKKAMRPDYT